MQARASATGVIVTAGRKIALGRLHQHQTITVLVPDTTLAIEFPDGDSKVVRRTTTQPVRSIKGPAAADRHPSFLDHCRASPGGSACTSIAGSHQDTDGVPARLMLDTRVPPDA